MCRYLVPFAVSSLLVPAEGQDAVGVVVLGDRDTAVVFDADYDAVLGSVWLAQGTSSPCSDVVLTSDLTRAYVANGLGVVLTLDLTGDRPRLGPGHALGQEGLEIALAPDEGFLLVCGRDPFYAQSPLELLPLGGPVPGSLHHAPGDLTSAEIGRHRVILATDHETSSVHRLELGSGGLLQDTGQALFLSGGADNAYLSREAGFGVVLARDARRIASFAVAGMAPVDTASLPGDDSGVATSAAFDASGGLLFATVASTTVTTVTCFTFDPATGALGDEPEWSTSMIGGSTCHGSESVAVLGEKLYVALGNGASVGILSTLDGAVRESIPVPGSPSSICVRRRGDRPPRDEEAGAPGGPSGPWRRRQGPGA